MTSFHPRIRHIPSVNEPLSADAFIIEGDSRYYVFDVGSSNAAYDAIRRLDKPVTVILSHFHRDHTANMERLQPEQTLAGARTMKYISHGTLVDALMVIRDGVTIEVQTCVSPHAPGCLIATMDRMFTFIGDLIYARPDVGRGEAKGMLNQLRRLETQYFVVSHTDDGTLVEKERLLQRIRDQFEL